MAMDTSLNELDSSSGIPKRWQVGEVPPDKSEDMRILFHSVFGGEMPFSYWQWKYGANKGMSVGVWEDKRLIAHCGLVYRTFFWGKNKYKAAQMSDLMVASSHRGILRRKSPFYWAVSTALDSFVKERGIEKFVFGFPSERAMRVGQTLNLFSEIDQMYQVEWLPKKIPSLSLSRVKNITAHSKKTSLSIDDLWARMAKDLNGVMVGERDSDYIKRRYFNHPMHQYRAYLVESRFWGKAIGFFVIREVDGLYEISDIVAPMSNINEVITHARNVACLAGIRGLYCWITGAFLAFFTKDAERTMPLEFRIPRVARDNFEFSSLYRNKLWLMAGDTEYR